MSTSTGQIIRKLSAAQAQQQFPRYVAIEGPIGVGKTTLAARLAESLKYPVLLEPVTENPFLDRFYEEGRSHALPTQLFFLLHRARQVSDLPQNDLLGPTLIADFLIEKDRLFAELTLDAEELALYEQIHKSLHINPPPPDLVVYLQAPAEVLKQRIIRRGIEFEQNVDSDYLVTLTEAYAEFFHYYKDAPVLIVNASEIDFANNDDHFELLIDQILKMDGTRQFFNPNPSLL
jgi:deoxyguanosine kinase